MSEKRIGSVEVEGIAPIKFEYYVTDVAGRSISFSHDLRQLPNDTLHALFAIVMPDKKIAWTPNPKVQKHDNLIKSYGGGKVSELARIETVYSPKLDKMLPSIIMEVTTVESLKDILGFMDRSGMVFSQYIIIDLWRKNLEKWENKYKEIFRGKWSEHKKVLQSDNLAQYEH